jgi:hypothetical protein
MGGVMSKTGIKTISLSNIVAVDNYQGISLMDGITEGGVVNISDSVFIGRTDPTTCTKALCDTAKNECL